jgi:hypothetical protein
MFYMLRRINITGIRKKNRSNKIFYVDAVKIVSKENNETYLNADITHLMQCRRKTLLMSSL